MNVGALSKMLSESSRKKEKKIFLHSKTNYMNESAYHKL